MFVSATARPSACWSVGHVMYVDRELRSPVSVAAHGQAYQHCANTDIQYLASPSDRATFCQRAARLSVCRYDTENAAAALQVYYGLACALGDEEKIGTKSSERL